MVLRISVLINQERLSFSIGDVKDAKQIAMYAHILESSDRICDISITKDYLIVTTEYPDPQNTASAPLIKKNQSTNNINAYDWMGNHIWNIGEIIGDCNVPFSGGTVTTKDSLISDIDASKISQDHEYYICFSKNNYKYIVDLTTKELVQRVHSR